MKFKKLLPLITMLLTSLCGSSKGMYKQRSIEHLFSSSSGEEAYEGFEMVNTTVAEEQDDDIVSSRLYNKTGCNIAFVFFNQKQLDAVEQCITSKFSSSFSNTSHIEISIQKSVDMATAFFTQQNFIDFKYLKVGQEIVIPKSFKKKIQAFNLMSYIFIIGSEDIDSWHNPKDIVNKSGLLILPSIIRRSFFLGSLDLLQIFSERETLELHIQNNFVPDTTIDRFMYGDGWIKPQSGCYLDLIFSSYTSQNRVQATFPLT